MQQNKQTNKNKERKENIEYVKDCLKQKQNQKHSIKLHDLYYGLDTVKNVCGIWALQEKIVVTISKDFFKHLMVKSNSKKFERHFNQSLGNYQVQCVE